MKRIKSLFGLITVISLFLGVIWLGPAMAAGEPAFESLGQIRADGMYVPGALDLDADGNIYVADGRNGHVYVFDKYGALSRELPLQVTGRGLAVSPDGKKLYVSRETEIISFDIATSTESVFVSGYGLVGEIDIDSHGYIYALDVKQVHVNIHDGAGQLISRFGEIGVGAGQFKQLGGLAIDSIDRVYVTDQAGDNGQVHVFTLDPLSYGVNTVVAYPRTSTGLYSALGAAFDSQDHVYIVDYVKHTVRVFQPDMSRFKDVNQNDVDLVLADKGREPGQLTDVNDIIFDKQNNRLIVACGSRLEVFGVDGGSSPVYVNHAPSTPTPYSPVAGSKVTALKPTLVFNNSSDSDGDDLSYFVVVNQEGTVVYQTEVPAAAGERTAVDVEVDLVENAAYSWTVQATDGKKTSAVSSPANFVVNATEEPPGSPVLISPVDGEPVSGQDALTWTATTDPDPNDSVVTYAVTVASDAQFAEIVASASLMDTALTIDSFADYESLVNGSTYFWQVVARDNAGTESEASAPGQFAYQTTTLTVTANVAGAKVSVHGNHAFPGDALGEAPLQLIDVAPGTLSVVVELAGFETFVSQVSLSEGSTIELYAELVPATVVGDLKIARKGINGRSGLSVVGSAAPFMVDFDNDGDLDLLVGDGNGQLTLFGNMQVTGRDDLLFDPGVQAGLPSVNANAIPFVADWNNDGMKDLLVGAADGTVSLFLNTGSDTAPSFDAGKLLQNVSVGLDAAPAVIYFNDDNKKDLLVANGDGKVAVFINQGTDAEPVLVADSVLPLGSGKSVVMPVDWDADGQKDLLLGSGGEVTVYSLVNGEYNAISNFSDKRNSYVAAFPVVLDGSGKQLLVGQADGEIVFLSGKAGDLVPVLSAILDTVSGLAGLVDESLAQKVDSVRAQIDSRKGGRSK